MVRKWVWIVMLAIIFNVLYAKMLGFGLDVYHFIFITILMLLIARLPKGLAHGLFGILIVIAAAYYPTLVSFGLPTIGIVAAAANTNMRESYEYVQRLTAFDVLLPVIFVIVSILFFRMVRGTAKPKKFVLVLLILALLLPVLTRYDKDYNKWVFAYKSGYFSVRTYKNEQKLLSKTAGIPATWHVNGRQNAYQNYVLILGESTRRDHMSVYDFPLETTPFLNDSKGLFFADMIAPAGSTYYSVPRMLSLQVNDQLQSNNNVVSLAKAAGFETHWFSNQGYIGAADTDISSFAMYADDYFFTKKGDWSFDNHDDFELLPKLQEALSRPSDKPKFIVLHVMGTHYHFCDRLFEGDKRLKDINQELSCYVSGVLKMDEFIKRTYQQLQATGQSFSMNYVSDHGVTYKGHDEKSYGLLHDTIYKENYEVPFMFLSSDDQAKRWQKARKNGFQYPKAFSEWLGIDVDELKAEPSFFTDEPQETMVYTRNGLIKFDDLIRDTQPKR